MGDNTKYLVGRHDAQEIAEKSTVAFYLASRDASAAEFHWRGVHKHFADLAKALGYRIEKIEADPVIFNCEICGDTVHESQTGYCGENNYCPNCEHDRANEEFRAVTGWQPASKEAADA